MATGASTADLAVVLIDARNGVLPQSRRHACIASLLGIPHVVVAVNKMDLVGYSEEVFEDIRQEFAQHLDRLGLRDAHFIPISALEGDNVVARSQRMPWYGGPSLLEHLETVPLASPRRRRPAAVPRAVRAAPRPDFRGYAGQLGFGRHPAGRSRHGSAVRPHHAACKSIPTFDGDLAEASPPMSIAVLPGTRTRHQPRRHAGRPAPPAPRFAAVSRRRWSGCTSSRSGPDRPYLLKHTTQQVTATVTALRHRLNVNTLERKPASQLELNEIGMVAIETSRPLFFDPYKSNPWDGELHPDRSVVQRHRGRGDDRGPGATSAIAGKRPKRRFTSWSFRPAA